MGAATGPGRLGWRPRRKWSVLAGLCAGSLAGIWLARHCPPAYEATAELAWTQAAPPGNSGLAAQLAQVLTAERLDQVLGGHPAYRAATRLNGETFARALLEPVATGAQDQGSGGPRTFALTVRAGRAAQAVAVLSDVAALLTTPPAHAPQPPDARRLRAQDALAARERAWQAFQAAHPQFSSGQASADAAMLLTLRQEGRELRDQLAQNQRLAAQQAQILRTLRRARPPARPAADATAGPLRALEERLAGLRTRYTDNYPDIKILKAQIAALQRQTAAPAPAPAASGGAKWRAKLSALAAGNAALARDIAAEQTQLSALARRQTALAEQVAAERRLQLQAAALQQALAQARAALRELPSRAQPAAQPAAPAVLERPVTARRTGFADPRLFSCLGLVLGAILGAAWAEWGERRDPRLWGEAAAAAAWRAPVLGSLPPLIDGRERVRIALWRGLERTAWVLLLAALVAGNLALAWRA
ncbi:MAG TPA: hypothetical protein VE996_09540 [Terriglobales bacterium]|nr:hypothetical protein [Terriglobales bacterium]